MGDSFSKPFGSNACWVSSAIAASFSSRFSAKYIETPFAVSQTSLAAYARLLLMSPQAIVPGIKVL
jgi:hypothetical protein